MEMKLHIRWQEYKQSRLYMGAVVLDMEIVILHKVAECKRSYLSRSLRRLVALSTIKAIFSNTQLI